MEEPKSIGKRDINTEGGNYNEQINGDYIQGNVIQNIINILSGQTIVSTPARSKSQQKLLIDVKDKVTGRLKDSLYNAILINLGKESQPQQVKRPWDAQIKIGLKPAEPLPDTITILEVFNLKEVAGKLLILGAPGSGKTTTQLELAQALIERAEEQLDYPIPVLFDLFSWRDERQPIKDWMIAELKSKHGVPTKLGEDWVENQQLLPMLDGLDELEPQRQELCIQAINQLLQEEYRPQFLVVSSRSEEYIQHKTKLNLNGAVYLQDLTNIQIEQYLGECNHTQIKEFSNNDIYLSDLIKIPFFLNIILLTYQKVALEEWHQLDTVVHENLFSIIKSYIDYLKETLISPLQQKILFENSHFFENASLEDIYQLTLSQVRINFLLNAYVERMLVRANENNPYKERTPNSNKTKRWLVWLATYMNCEFKTEFIIEDLQPSSLDYIDSLNANKRIYSITLVSLPLFIIAPLQFVIPPHWVSFSILGVEPSDLLLLLLIVIKIFGDTVLQEFDDFYLHITPFESVSFSWRKALGKFFTLAFYGINIGFTLSIIVTNFLNLDIRLDVWHTTIIISILFGIFGVLKSCLVEGDINTKLQPNQGIKISSANAFKFTGFFGILVGVSIWFYFGVYSGILAGAISGLLGGLIFGGLACVQHLILRLFLYINGYSPWNYTYFLDYCTERLLLQRVGGRYRFIHKLLQDYFAQMPLDTFK